MWSNQEEWVGSRKRHVTGFRLGLYFNIMSIEFETTCVSLQHKVYIAWLLDLYIRQVPGFSIDIA